MDSGSWVLRVLVTHDPDIADEYARCVPAGEVLAHFVPPTEPSNLPTSASHHHRFFSLFSPGNHTRSFQMMLWLMDNQELSKALCVDGLKMGPLFVRSSPIMASSCHDAFGHKEYLSRPQFPPLQQTPNRLVSGKSF